MKTRNDLLKAQYARSAPTRHLADQTYPPSGKLPSANTPTVIRGTLLSRLSLVDAAPCSEEIKVVVRQRPRLYIHDSMIMMDETMHLDKTELALASAILRTHAEMQDHRAVKLATENLPDDIRDQVDDLQEDSEVMIDLAMKMERMIADAPAE